MDYPNAEALNSSVPGVWRKLARKPGELYRWGFYLYRATYDDQHLWERYISFLSGMASSYLARDTTHRRQEIRDKFRLSLVEDPDALDGATMNDVKARFQNWSDSLPDEGIEDEEVPKEQNRDYARFRYCLFVDAECLESFKQQEGRLNDYAGGDHAEGGAFVKVINAEHQVIDSEGDDSEADENLEEEEAGQEEDGFEEDWMYIDCRWVCAFYDIVQDGGYEWDRQLGMCKYPTKTPWRRC
ncbi:hypothetical protein CkaCkLH20_07365 [Colletotrichum karsti]|uniref:Uncharacterized protein n=1 Tax=Colletotrichum karsti TaxID=1095194 RepID=A0A9P6LGD7_9PEZI|nr:uncharacterized protein CkaCkLH20_07365 [Colletotrichum karsti]KAF9875099.1 hypothetical protein CkaCkLH20_07365 [Colletotrichum karsti]